VRLLTVVAGMGEGPGDIQEPCLGLRSRDLDPALDSPAKWLRSLASLNLSESQVFLCEMGEYDKKRSSETNAWYVRSSRDSQWEPQEGKEWQQKSKK
jgi:hypothetical protein